MVTASVAALAGAGYLAYRWGLWQPVQVRESTVGPVVCVYKDYGVSQTGLQLGSGPLLLSTGCLQRHRSLHLEPSLQG